MIMGTLKHDRAIRLVLSLRQAHAVPRTWADESRSGAPFSLSNRSFTRDGISVLGHGYNSQDGTGALSDTSFEFNSRTATIISIERLVLGSLNLNIDPGLDPVTDQELIEHVRLAYLGIAALAFLQYGPRFG